MRGKDCSTSLEQNKEINQRNRERRKAKGQGQGRNKGEFFFRENEIPA